MKHTEFRIQVLTSDRYLPAILPFAFLLKKYWPAHPEVVVGGYTPPVFAMPEKFVFHSIGKFSDYPIGRWSDGLIKFLTDIPDEIVMLFLEDMWLIRTVRVKNIQMCYDYIRQFEYIARLDLTGDRLWANGGNVSLYGRLGDADLIWSDPNSPYHLSMMPAFWRKRHLLRVLIPGESPWDVEISGTNRLSSLRREMIVLGTNAWPIRNTLAFRGGDWNKLLLDEINTEDVKQMRELGLLDWV